MKIFEKIRDYRKNTAKLSLKEFHEKLVDIFGEKALTYYSLCRLEKGRRAEIRLTSLYQICTGLGISLKDLKEGTELEESKIVSIIRKESRPDNRFIYNEKASAEIVSAKDLRFLAMELEILPGGATKHEEDPPGHPNYEKLLIMLHGFLICHVGAEKHEIKKGDSISFASCLPHYYENPSQRDSARCIIIQNPKSY